MIKKLFFSIGLVLMSLAASAQDSFVKWQTKTNHLEGDTYQIMLEATLKDGWHMYDMTPSDWVNPTVIDVREIKGAVADGKAYQIGTPTKIYEEIFKSDIYYFEEKATFAQNVRLTEQDATVKLNVEWMICDDMTCLPLTDSTFTVTIRSPHKITAAAGTPTGNDTAVSAPEEQKGGSLWALIIEAIIWGFAALLTPCVFPMIPMTLSFFMKGEGSATAGRIRAFTYGLFIVLLYTLPIAAIILVTRIVGGDAVTADIFNWLATHWIPNILFFVIFMIFAASFFGAFEITLPSWMVNKSDEKADKGGLVGLFFMALTLVLVSFSCTGPIVGTVLIKSTQGEFWEPIITMLAFSIAFALPFTIFAMFPTLLKKLPKSGGWLNSVKVVLGFIEVALGFKFLSVADQTYHWGLLDREVYLGIWIVVFTMLGFYLLGKLRFKHDDETSYVSVPRLALSIVVFTFVVYMIPGMWGAPLKALSGYMPPISTQDFILSGNNGGVVVTNEASPKAKTAKYSDFLHLPHGLDGYFDLNEGLAAAKAANKPVFVDVTGHGCVNCREMEARVWSDPRVLEILRNDYVVVALYTDDKKRADEADWIKNEKGDVLKNIGRINSYISRTRFGVNAQPNYVLLDTDGEMMAPPRGYDLNVDGFIEFLENGLKTFKEK